MADALENAIRDTGRVPNLVLGGHVHNYQRIEQTIGEHTIPFIVNGNGGYHNLHKITGTVDQPAPDTGAVLKYGKEVWGFLTLTIENGNIHGATTEITRDGSVTAGDTFAYPTALIRLSDPKSVPTL
ncbi:MAG: hypothetical protein JOZ58_15900 [Acetobacteraceae bacterium]|nr:hypothetical protein [Acetobacteraceae bacterium]